MFLGRLCWASEFLLLPTLVTRRLDNLIFVLIYFIHFIHVSFGSECLLAPVSRGDFSVAFFYFFFFGKMSIC